MLEYLLLAVGSFFLLGRAFAHGGDGFWQVMMNGLGGLVAAIAASLPVPGTSLWLRELVVLAAYVASVGIHGRFTRRVLNWTRHHPAR